MLGRDLPTTGRELAGVWDKSHFWIKLHMKSLGHIGLRAARERVKGKLS
jgi:hypothetical protein